MLTVFFFLTFIGLLLLGVGINLYLYAHRALKASSPQMRSAPAPTLHEAIFQ